MDKILGKFSLEQATELVMDSYRGVSSNPKYSAEERREGARNLLTELSKDYTANKGQIFQIIERTLTELLPKRLDETIGRFAEVQRFAEGDTPRFRVKNGEIKAYSVALGGTVQRHRKSTQSIIVEVDAIQVKVYEELPRVRAGLVDFNELIDDALDEMEKEFYNRINQTLAGTYNVLPESNKRSNTEVKERELDELIAIVGSYGKPMIMGTGLALSTLPEIKSHESDTDIYNQGFIGRYKGIPCVKLENSVTDRTNTEFILDDSLIYIIPEGQDKIVKVAMEGDAYVRESDGQDWTLNYEMMQQSGVAVLQTHNFAIYENTSLKAE